MYIFDVSEKNIGSYRILKKIGSGGMATVYLAVHRDVPNLRVVVKLLSDPGMVERFRQEADKLALLDGHGNICQIKHFFNHGDDFAIAMEYIDGVTLDDLIKKKGKLSINESIRIVVEVLNTLRFAHERGICHRDIKPSNLMIDKQNRVKIIDFGIAKAEGDPNLTVAGSSCGTPTYMPPEQFNPTDTTDYTLADIYAVGTTLYYLTTGELPFKGDNAFALRDAKLFSDPVRPRRLNKEISKELEDIILKALEKNPQDRYAAAEQMRKALENLRRADKPVAAGSVDTADTDVLKPARKKRPIFRRIPIIAALVVAAVAVVYMVFLRGGPGEPTPPKLYTPRAGATVETRTPNLRWETSAGEGGAYELHYAADPEFSNPRTIAGLAIGEFTWTNPLPEEKYFWRVKAINADGKKSDFSETYSFLIGIAESAIPRGDMELTVSPSGDIYIDDELRGRDKNNLRLTLDTGTYIIRVENRRSVQKAIVDTIYLAENARISRNFRFSFPSQKPDKPAQVFGRLGVGSRPVNGAVIYIDGQRQEHRTPYSFKLKSGQYIVAATLELGGNMLTMTDTVNVSGGSDEKLVFNFEE